MSGYLTAICDREIPEQSGNSGAPEWVHLFPSGVMAGRDGRVFNLADPQAVMNAFQADGIDLPVDYDHQQDKPKLAVNGPTPAAGWIKELQNRANGLWGRVEWTAQARELLENKAYRYLSPSFRYLEAGNIITKLKGAGLVHNPNLHLTALASQEETMTTDNDNSNKPNTSLIERLAALFALAPGTGEEDIFAAIENMLADATKPDPKKFVPIEALQEALLDRNTGIATMSKERATTRVKDALERGYISPAMKDWATALCTQDEASFDTFMKKSAPPYAHLLKPVFPAGYTGPSSQTGMTDTPTEADAICQQLGLKSGTLEN